MMQIRKLTFVGKKSESALKRSKSRVMMNGSKNSQKIGPRQARLDKEALVHWRELQSENSGTDSFNTRLAEDMSKSYREEYRN